jgi:hypothetical protein
MKSRWRFIVENVAIKSFSRQTTRPTLLCAWQIAIARGKQLFCGNYVYDGRFGVVEGFVYYARGSGFNRIVQPFVIAYVVFRKLHYDDGHFSVVEYIHTYHSRFILERVSDSVVVEHLRYFSKLPTFYHNYSAMSNTADATGGKPVAAWLQSISGVRTSVLWLSLHKLSLVWDKLELVQ